MDVRQLAALSILLLLAILFAAIARREILKRRPKHVSIEIVRAKRG